MIWPGRSPLSPGDRGASGPRLPAPGPPETDPASDATTSRWFWVASSPFQDGSWPSHSPLFPGVSNPFQASSRSLRVSGTVGVRGSTCASARPRTACVWRMPCTGVALLWSGSRPGSAIWSSTGRARCGGTGFSGSPSGTRSSATTSAAAGYRTATSAIRRSTCGSAISKRSSTRWAWSGSRCSA